MVDYTDNTLVTGTRVTNAPTYGRTVSGYGGKIPSRYMIRYAGRWRRVYVMQYGNAGSAYIVVNGADAFLDTDTEHALTSAVPACEAPGAHHSDDIVTVYSGRADGPVTLCGFHASQR